VHAGLESKSREAVKQEVTLYAQLQWIGPEDGIQAIKDGTTDAIGADFEYDRGRAYEIIQKIKQGPEVLFNMPSEFRDIEIPVTDPMGMPAIDPVTGGPLTRKEMIEVPGWMPREVDNTAIHKAIFARWMKSAEWGMLDPGMREAARLYWRALDEEEQKRAQAAAGVAVGAGVGAWGGERGEEPGGADAVVAEPGGGREP
jgi:hypothetical protein